MLSPIRRLFTRPVAVRGLAFSLTAAVLPCAGALPASAATAPPRALDARAVRVEQVAWVEGGGLPTPTGVLTIDPKQIQALTGAAAGYVSVFDGRRFTVVNAPVQVDTKSHWPARVTRAGQATQPIVPPLSVEFDLGTRQPLRSVRAVVIHSQAPLVGRAAFQAAAALPPTVLPVTPLRMSLDTGMALPEPPLVVQAPFDSPALPDLPMAPGNTWSVIQPHGTNVQAAYDQCTTAAVANGLFYLDDAFTIGVDHLPGRGVAPADGLMLLAWLDGLGHRPSDGQCEGDGTFACRYGEADGYAPGNDRGFMDALYRYMHGFLDPSQFTMAHQGGDPAYPAACSLLDVPGPVSLRQAEKPTFSWMCDRIAAGDAVLVGTIQYAVPEGAAPGAPQVAQSAHMLRAYGCGESAGSRYLYLLDDGAQDGMTDDAVPMCSLNDGLRWWIRGVRDTDGDGWLNIKDDLHEIEFALAIGVK